MENTGKGHCCTPSRKQQGEIKIPVVADPTKGAVLDGMIKLSGGLFLMGTNDQAGFPADGEGPVREVEVNPFYMEATTVTNAQFESFIKDTGYLTDAERYAWSFVFWGLLSDVIKKTDLKVLPQTPWWCAVPGASWKNPEGPGSHIIDKMDHPVVHVSWNDATAYCRWTGKRLPTEAEWEFAARGGLVQKKFPWGDELTPEGKHQCNIWQGNFPYDNSLEDGFFGTAPAKSFTPNDYGLYNMAGNVWQWCSDWFGADFHVNGLKMNPVGPAFGQKKVMKGGSFLCHHSYCNRYRVAARSSNTPDSSTSNLGFRCVAGR